MWRLVPVLALVGLSFVELIQAPTAHIRYYVQLVRADDSSQPPQTGSQPLAWIPTGANPPNARGTTDRSVVPLGMPVTLPPAL